MSTIDSGHYEAHYGGEERRQEAVLICAQTRAPGILFAQVGRR